MIDISKLTESDKNREVCYETYGKIEFGRITSWNDTYIFVRYHLKVEGDKRTQRFGDTSEATRPEDLEFAT